MTRQKIVSDSTILSGLEEFHPLKTEPQCSSDTNHPESAPTSWVRGTLLQRPPSLGAPATCSRVPTPPTLAQQLATNLAIPMTPSDFIIYWNDSQNSEKNYTKEQFYYKGYKPGPARRRDPQGESWGIPKRGHLWPLPQSQMCHPPCTPMCPTRKLS